MNTALELRSIADLSQEQAAKVLDVSSRTWRNWENGTPPMPLKKAQAFQEALSQPLKPVSSSDELFYKLCSHKFDLPDCLKRKPQQLAKDMKPISREPREQDLEPIVIMDNEVTAADLAELSASIKKAKVL